MQGYVTIQKIGQDIIYTFSQYQGMGVPARLVPISRGYIIDMGDYVSPTLRRFTESGIAISLVSAR